MKKSTPTRTIGTILTEDFLEPYGLSQNDLAKDIKVSMSRINGIVKGTRGITADTDVRFAKYFGIEKGYFLNIQTQNKILLAEQKLSEKLSQIIPVQQKMKR